MSAPERPTASEAAQEMRRSARVIRDELKASPRAAGDEIMEECARGNDRIASLIESQAAAIAAAREAPRFALERLPPTRDRAIIERLRAALRLLEPEAKP